MSNNQAGRHGIVRGLDSVARSSSFEGRFGRMFRTLPAATWPEDALKKLAAAMSADAEESPTPENKSDDEENSGISAGYTYFGQFIDHDITFDPNSSLQKDNDVNGLVDFRTPRLDLDNVYGRGPDDQPYMYDNTGMKFLLGRQLTGAEAFAHNVKDLQRITTEPKRAIIGDPRNDENVIVSQLQGAFLRFHNYLVETMPGSSFSDVQREVRFHYQWAVLHDFLPTIIGQKMVDDILSGGLKFYKPRKEAYMPVEFSVAAYRFGHSMVRPIYRLSQTIPRFAIFSNDPGSSLTGFREFPSNWAIDWRLFFNFGNNPNPLSPERIQPAYKIDTSLVNPLANLPASVGGNIPSLPFRNLLRGLRMGLPCGQDVACKMNVTPIPDKNLKVGKATEGDTATNKSIVDIDPSFKGKAPLWFYILAEAQQQFKKNNTPIRLGEVGGRIVGEVLIGLLLNDSHSYLSMAPCWQPRHDLLLNGKFSIAALIAAAGKSSNV
ncbi:peroxidase family protein [Ferruginibacter sp.]